MDGMGVVWEGGGALMRGSDRLKRKIGFLFRLPKEIRRTVEIWLFFCGWFLSSLVLSFVPLLV